MIGCTGIVLLADGLVDKGKAVLAQKLLEASWERTLKGEEQAKPWPWADIWPVASIDVPRHGASAIALSGTSGEALAFGPGHVEGSSQPGSPGLSIFAAHRDTHFRFLKNIRTDDEIRVTDRNGKISTYRVTERRIVDASASGLVPELGGPRLVLVTCYPFTGILQGSKRFVVIADLLDTN